jgi:membrane associated rhomboid family serine protease
MMHQGSHRDGLHRPIFTAIGLVSVLWVLHLLRLTPLLDDPVGYYGIYPRRLFGLKGVLTSPLFHGGWRHLMSNSAPLLAMITVLYAFYRRVATPAFIAIYLLTGLAVWLFARPVWHVGASGVVYGLVSFVFWSGVFRRSLKSIVLALIVVMIYTPMFAGILPNQEGISWESHLLGGIVGILVAWWFRSNLEKEELKPVYDWEEDSEKTSFLDADTFEKTRLQREWERLQKGAQED